MITIRTVWAVWLFTVITQVGACLWPGVSVEVGAYSLSGATFFAIYLTIAGYFLPAQPKPGSSQDNPCRKA